MVDALQEAKPPYRTQWRRAKPKLAAKGLKPRSLAVFALDPPSSPDGNAVWRGSARPLATRLDEAVLAVGRTLDPGASRGKRSRAKAGGDACDHRDRNGTSAQSHGVGPSAPR
jgi:hypothetical protein